MLDFGRRVGEEGCGIPFGERMMPSFRQDLLRLGDEDWTFSGELSRSVFTFDGDAGLEVCPNLDKRVE